jgi:hypothetical protein
VCSGGAPQLLDCTENGKKTWDSRGQNKAWERWTEKKRWQRNPARYSNYIFQLVSKWQIQLSKVEMRWSGNSSGEGKWRTGLIYAYETESLNRSNRCMLVVSQITTESTEQIYNSKLSLSLLSTASPAKTVFDACNAIHWTLLNHGFSNADSIIRVRIKENNYASKIFWRWWFIYVNFLDVVYRPSLCPTFRRLNLSPSSDD